MKKLVLSLFSILATVSLVAMEKPATPDVDFETYRIEKMRGENPQVHIMQAKLIKLREEAKKATGSALEKIKAKINKYETLIEAQIK
jgi:DNA-directed RNA polymerase subunit L